MLKRLKYGLFYPSNIAELKNDNKIYTILFFFLLVVLSALPALLLINHGNALDYNTKKEIRSIFHAEKVPYIIHDYTLQKTVSDKDPLTVAVSDTLGVVFNHTADVPENAIGSNTIIYFAKERVYLIRPFLLKLSDPEPLFSYNEYGELQELDLRTAFDNDADFWNIAFEIIEAQLEKTYYSSYAFNLIFYFVLPVIFELIIFSLIMAFFQKKTYEVRAGIIKFAAVWQLMIYILLPYVLFSVFANLYGMYFLTFAGMIISIIYSRKVGISLILGKGGTK